MLTQSSNLFSSDSSFRQNMDSNRNLRRCIMPHKEAEFSSQSIMKAMEKFVQAVQEMDETILVPSRLMDLQVGDSEDTADLKASTRTNGKRTAERDNLSSTDLFRLYTMVNCVKNELLWGVNSMKLGGTGFEESVDEGCSAVSSSSVNSNMGSCSSGTSNKGHNRRPSVTSLASSQSLSDTDSETGNENDSGIEGESEAIPDFTQKMEDNFRRHLYGLHKSLTQMSSAAQYLTKRYQNDIGATV